MDENAQNINQLIYSPPVNNDGYNSQSNNIYSAAQSGFAPKTGGNIYSQANNNLYPQNSGNIYPPPQNNPVYAPPISAYVPPPVNPPVYSPQVSGEITPVYVPQVSGEIKVDVPQPNLNVVSPEPNIVPLNVANPISVTSPTEPISTAPLIPPTNVVANTESSCCGGTDESMAELSGCQKCINITLGVFVSFGSFCCIIIGSIIDEINHGIFIPIDIIFLLYGVFIAVSVLRNRCLRVTSTVLSVIFFILGIVGTVFEIVLLNERKAKKNELIGLIDNYCFFVYSRIFWLFCILNALFYNYWGIKICRCDTSSSGTYHSGRSHFHHHSPPHHTAIHHSAPHHSAPHHSAPHRSAPHHSAPHHSAPHHGGGHHGGGSHGGHHGGRHGGRH